MSNLTVHWLSDKVGEQLSTVEAGQGAVIGRDPGCDIVLRSPFVSRRHAVIYHEREAFHLRNLSDTNPTIYNDRWSLDSKTDVDLRPGDCFTIGLVRLNIPL